MRGSSVILHGIGSPRARHFSVPSSKSVGENSAIASRILTAQLSFMKEVKGERAARVISGQGSSRSDTSVSALPHPNEPDVVSLVGLCQPIGDNVPLGQRAPAVARTSA